jgi:hypothetical protein
LGGDIPFGPILWRFSFSVDYFAHICNNVSDFIARSFFRTETRLPQGYGFHKLLKLSNHLSTVKDPVYNITHRDVIKKCISDPCVFYGDVINKAK